jgi:hypothetical protein
MANVVVTFTTKDVTEPAGTVQGKYVVSVTGQPDQSVDASPVTFANVPPGDYVASVQATDTNGGTIGGKATASFTVSAPDVTLAGADVVTVQVSA